MITLILTRHGETDWNRDGKLAGSTDKAVLTEEGFKQARAVANALKNMHVDVIYCSKLRRAKQTAQIISKTLGKKITYNGALNERSWGNLEGKSWDKQKDKLVAMYESEKTNLRPSGGESCLEFKERLLFDLEKIIEANEGKTVLIITHGGVIRTLIKAFKKIPDEEMVDLRVNNTSLTIFRLNEGKVEEEILNDIKHLE